MKINWHSNAPWGGTGYANQTKLFTPQIKALGYDISITAFWGLQGGMIESNGIRIYPNGHHPYGQDVIGASAAMEHADAIISLMDVWVMQPENIPPEIAWFPWFPIDTEPISKIVLDKAKLARKGITMSQFGQAQAKAAGLDTFYVPHGVDCNVFKPLDRTEARARLQWPADKFIIGMVAANKGIPPRKSFFEQITAFAAIHKAHPDTMLYLHTEDGRHGAGQTVDLRGFCETLGLKCDYQKNGPVDAGVDVLFAEQYTYLLGLPEPYLVDCYNAFDVLMLVSMGEGFGIPLIEAQACGCPVITGDWTSMSELCLSGWKIPKDEARATWNPYFSAWQWSVDPEAVADRLELAYLKRGNLHMREEARRRAMKYDADRVTEEYWKPVLSEIEKMSGHKHEWLTVGLYNPDGSLSFPCKTCGAELKQTREGHLVIPGGFVTQKDIEFCEPDGLEYILMRECAREYDAGLPELQKVIDIGAHVGVVSMYLARKYGAEVWAYEPEPDNYRRLVLNIEKNGLGKLIHPFNLAVTADGRDVVIGGGGDNSGGNSIFGADGATVHSTTLPTILSQTGIVNLLKIDCEGAEFEILNDPNLLHRYTEAVRGEIHCKHGDGAALLAKVKEAVPNTSMVVLQ